MEARLGAITVLTDAFLIDCTGKEPVDGAAVVIEGERIKAEWIEPAECCLGMVHAIADGPDEVRKAAREQLRHDVDQIKIMASGGAMSPSDELDTNRRQGQPAHEPARLPERGEPPPDHEGRPGLQARAVTLHGILRRRARGAGQQLLPRRAAPRRAPRRPSGSASGEQRSLIGVGRRALLAERGDPLHEEAG